MSITYLTINQTLLDILNYLNKIQKFEDVTYCPHFNNLELKNQNYVYIPNPNHYTYSIKINEETIQLELIVKQIIHKSNDYYLPYSYTFVSDKIDMFMNYIKSKTSSIISYIYNNGYWMQKQTNSKTFDTIYLPSNYKTNILQIIQNFQNDKLVYEKFEQLYKLNFLFYGLPGTGKTSISYAISNYLSKPIYFVNLFNYSSDDHFINSMKNINDSIVVIEDIDCCFQNKKPNDIKRNNISMTCILNFLDGFNTIPGNITIVTANHINEIDNSFLRSLRIDHQFEFTFMDTSQIIDILNKYIPENPDINSITNIILEKKITPADLIKFLFDRRTSTNIVNDIKLINDH